MGFNAAVVFIGGVELKEEGGAGAPLCPPHMLVLLGFPSHPHTLSFSFHTGLMMWSSVITCLLGVFQPYPEEE